MLFAIYKFFILTYSLICIKILNIMRIWRNWQTRMVQVHMKAISCRFKSCYPHHILTCQSIQSERVQKHWTLSLYHRVIQNWTSSLHFFLTITPLPLLAETLALTFPGLYEANNINTRL